MSADEIKLYGESENDDALDESFSEDSFSDLEAVMTKVHKGYEISISIDTSKKLKLSTNIWFIYI